MDILEKYKQILAQIVCDEYVYKSNFVEIETIYFTENGVLIYYKHYNEDDIIITSRCNIVNSKLNAYIFENQINK